MKRYLFATLVVFFGYASVDAGPYHMQKPPHSQNGFKYDMEEGMKRKLPNGHLQDAKKPFNRRHPSEISEGKDFGNRHPDEMMRKKRHREHFNKHEGSRFRPGKHSDRRHQIGLKEERHNFNEREPLNSNFMLK